MAPSYNKRESYIQLKDGGHNRFPSISSIASSIYPSRSTHFQPSTSANTPPPLPPKSRHLAQRPDSRRGVSERPDVQPVLPELSRHAKHLDHRNKFEKEPDAFPTGPKGPPPASQKLDAEKAPVVSVRPVTGGPPQKPAGPPGAGGPHGPLLSEGMSKKRELAFMVIICMVQLIPQADLSNCFPTSAIIAESFGITDRSLIPWMIAAYALTFGTFILIGGRLGDIFGHKRMVIIGFLWMAFWSLAAGLSTYAGYTFFFLARALQGIGPAMMQPNGLALLGRTYAPGSKKKNFAFALFGFMAPVGAYFGMIFGAFFAQMVEWQLMFFVTAGVCVGQSILSFRILIAPPPSPVQLKPFREKLHEMDWAGAITGVAGLVCIEVAWVCAPAQGWPTQWIFMILILGLVLVAVFIMVELRQAERPLIPFRQFKSDVYFVLAAVACGWASFGIWIFYLWQFLLHVHNDTPLFAAALVFPVVPLGFVASLSTAWMMHKVMPSIILLLALIAATLGSIFMSITPVDQTYWGFTFASLFVFPFFMDMSFPAATIIMSNAMPPHMQGVAGSLTSTVVNYSISLGLGFAATVDASVNRGGGTPADVLRGYRGAFYMGIGLAALGIAVCVIFFIIQRTQQRRQQPVLPKFTMPTATTVESRTPALAPLSPPATARPPPSARKPSQSMSPPASATSARFPAHTASPVVGAQIITTIRSARHSPTSSFSSNPVDRSHATAFSSTHRNNKPLNLPPPVVKPPGLMNDRPMSNMAQLQHHLSNLGGSGNNNNNFHSSTPAVAPKHTSTILASTAPRASKLSAVDTWGTWHAHRVSARQKANLPSPRAPPSPGLPSPSFARLHHRNESRENLLEEEE